MNQVDRYTAAAESGLERLDDEQLERDTDPETPQGPPPDGVASDDYGFHVDDPEADLLTDDLDAGLRDDAEADAIDVVAECFNARDLDGLLEILAGDGEAPGLLGYDKANLPDAVQDLWERRPTCCMTRGLVDTEHVGVLWEYDGAEWWRVAVVHVDDVVDEHVGVIEFSDDPALLERVDSEGPDGGELEEGSTWAEWDEGTDGTP